jgi:hypothetical protein
MKNSTEQNSNPNSTESLKARASHLKILVELMSTEPSKYSKTRTAKSTLSNFDKLSIKAIGTELDIINGKLKKRLQNK